MSWIGGRFSRKLTLAFAAVVALAVLSTGIFLYWSFRSNLLNVVSQDLLSKASVIALQADPSLLVTGDRRALQGVAKRLAAASGTRITLIDRTGLVLGDSSQAFGTLDQMGNHVDRPEVAAALRGGRSIARRESETVSRPFIYAAVPVLRGGAPVGVVRAAISLEDFSGRLRVIAAQMAWIGLVVLLVAMLVARRVARSYSRPVEEMSRAGRRMADGAYHVRVHDLPADEHGRLGHVLNDLAARVQSQVEQLWYDRDQLRAVLSSLQEGVAAVDNQGRVVAVNQALCALFGIEAAGASGRPFIEVLRHSSLDQMVQAVLRGADEQLSEVRTFLPDERTFEAHAVPFQKGADRAGALLVLHDITRLRKLEQMRRDFVANVSHELRTPLTAIKGFAETLRSGGIEDARNRVEFVEGIERHADRMAALVEDLLDLAAIESGRRPLMIEPVPLDALIADVVSDLRPLSQRRRVGIRVDLPPSLPKVKADRRQIRHVFTNLIDNALKFSPEGSAVTVTARSEGSVLHVIVADNGPGIPSQDLSRIFERFYRVDKARSRELGGTGLGLSIVKHIVDAHGGAVHVESVLGKGTSFDVILPIAP